MQHSATLSPTRVPTRRPRRAVHRFIAAAMTLSIGVALTACGTPPTATPEPVPPTALPEPVTIEAPTDTPVVEATATLTPTATAATLAPTAVPTVAGAAVAPLVAPSLPTAAPSAVPTTVPTAVPTANSGAPLVEFFPDNGQFEVDKGQLCIAVNWRTQNVTDVRLEWGGKATSVAASGRQTDICFPEKKIELKLIYKLGDGREESRSIEIKRKG